MKKVLITNIVGMGYEGISSVIINYIKNIDRSELEINLLVYSDTNETLLCELKQLGNIHVVANRKKNLFSYFKDLCSILAHKYDVFHIHGNSGTMFIEVAFAKILGVDNIITHCHNTTCNHPIINKILKTPMCWFADRLLACSEQSGQWLYGKKKYFVLKNAIDIERYLFDKQKRIDYRNEFACDNVFVIGHIGHFTRQKNHLFLVDIFAQYLKLDSTAKLLLLSDGPNFSSIKEKVEELKITDNVIFAGRRSDAYLIYNAMDVFVLPSLWEGLPLVMLEAQANGLPLLVSSNITEDAKCTDRTYYYDLQLGAEAWAKKIYEIKLQKFQHDDMSAEIRMKGFDIRKQANVLREIYLGE